MARTDARHDDSPEALERAIDRGRRYAASGADLLFIRGLSRDQCTAELAEAVGVPVVFDGVKPVDEAYRQEVAAAGMKVLLHGIYPIHAGFTTLKNVYEGLKAGTVEPLAEPQSEVTREILRTVDLPGWTRRLAELPPPADA